MLKVEIAADGKGKRLITTATIPAGSAFHMIRRYCKAPQRTFTSVQIGIDHNIEEFFLAHLNHSCHPNVIVDTSRMELQAIRDIHPGEDLTFFYPSTEWEMAEPFTCLCGADTCLGTISGAKNLTLSVLGRYFINQHIGMMAISHLLGPERAKVPVAV